ncbi:MAG: hypothetical protein QXV17_07545 [Candidatus Micrarchaeaceae archaeon]
MKKLLMIASSLLLVSCSSLTTTQTKAYYTSCIAFDSIVQEATNAVQNGKISLAKAKEIQNIINSTAILCEGNQPTNSTEIVNKINNATATINKELTQ